MTRFLALLLGLLLPASPSLGAASVSPLEEFPDGVLLELKGSFLRVVVLGDSLVRVSYAKDPSFFEAPSLAVPRPLSPFTDWTLEEGPQKALLKTSRMGVEVAKATGLVRFLDAQGTPVLAEAGRTLTAAKVQGTNTFHVRQKWTSQPGESLYGLGQHQFGILDWKGHDLDLWQRNTTAVVPFLVSSRGYGLLWDNPSFTRFGDLREFTPIPPKYLSDREGRPGGLTLETAGSATITRAVTIQGDLKGKKWDEKPKTLTWTGFLTSPATGDHQFDAYSNGGLKVWLDGALVMDQWRQGWLTEHDRARIPLKAGQRVPLKVEWDTEQGSTLDFRWKTPNASQDTSLWSEVGQGVDYTFVQGPSLDQVLSGYRTLTGPAPLMPRWAFGLWQSRQRYETSKESLEVVKGFRERRIPFDAIVQDWQYWKKDAWGSHGFDQDRFPDPEGWLKALHALKAHVMISVWPKFYEGTDNYQEMMDQGFLYKKGPERGLKDWLGFPYSFYDAFHPEARKLFWRRMEERLFKKGVDAWWMDATEPDLMPSPPTREALRDLMHPTAAGPGSKVLNAYPLMNSRAVFEGQRTSSPDQRVFILTRCAWLGSQSTASAVWSGDITATWSFLAKQVPAGLNMSLSGIPYWTSDIGGYTMPWKFSRKDPKPEDEEEWRELNVRWFQFATFCPLLRSHGETRPREMWAFGGEKSPAYQAMLKFDRLRYRLFPYLYSTAWDVTNGSTFMRPMVMDFPGQRDLHGLTDQYLFGKSLLVAPVVTYQARQRKVRLPQGAVWYDFWTGEAHDPGTLEAEAPFDSLPLFVKAGSILPLGPELQTLGEKPQDPTTLRVYTGADGDFTLYEDDGETYGYEKGESTEIPIHWDDQAGELTIGERKGAFPGMLKERTFQVVLVRRGRPVGFSFEPKPDRKASYQGKALVLRPLSSPGG